MDREFFLRHIKQKKDIYGEIFKYSRCFSINNNIDVFGVSANCLMEAQSDEEETESERALVFFQAYRFIVCLLTVGVFYCHKGL